MTNKILWKGGAVVTVFLIVIATLGWSSVETGAGPPIPKPTATPEAAPVPTPTDTPSPTETPAPAPTRTPEPTATPDLVIEITAAYKVDAVMIWLSEIERLNEWHEFGLDPALVLAVMAAESGGDHSVVSYAGACGLMQVIPKTWFRLSAKDICSSRVGNIYTGMSILRGALGLAEERGYSMEYGLAYYNCSVDNVHSDGCGSKGGLHYADGVLNFWLPRIMEAMANDPP